MGSILFGWDGMGGMGWVRGGVFLWKDGEGNWVLGAGFVDVEDWVLV